MVGQFAQMPGPLKINRRMVVPMLAGFLCRMRAARAKLSVPRRVVALDAPSTEMLAMLGIEPVGVAGLDGYRQTERDIPALRHAVDIGFFYEPNLELLQFLKPDLFIGSFGVGAPADLLKRIAPVLSLPIYGGQDSSHEAAVQSLRQISGAMSRRDEAEAFLAAYQVRLSALALSASAGPRRPVYLASLLLDGRHVILYGQNSLFHKVLLHAGLRNAFVGESSAWGIASVAIGTLDAAPDAVFLYIKSPVTQAALAALEQSPIWKALPFVKARRIVPIPYLEMYGALPTAERFADIVGMLVERGTLDAD